MHGVSLNAIIGENGVITNAANAKFESGMAALEEFIQEKYVENYESLSKYDSKAEGLISTSDCSKYFYIPSKEGVGALSYVIDNEGHALYLIKKSELPEEIKTGLVGGDAGEGEYVDYAGLNDVYGVTSNLKVYYCSGGIDIIKGLSKNDLDKDNPNRVVFPENSPLAAVLGKEGEAVTADDVKSVTELTLDSNSRVTSLSDFYNLTSLKELILDGVMLDNLNGIENCPLLNYVLFKNYSDENISINDYSALSGVQNLTYLYLLKSCNKQVADLCDGIENAEFSKLQYLGIFGDLNEYNMAHIRGNRIKNATRSNVTDISSLSKLSNLTKKSIKYLYLNNNNFSDISCLEDFENLITIFAPNGAITSLKGLENKKYLTDIIVNNNNIGINETSVLNKEVDSLAIFEKNEAIEYIDLTDNLNLKNVGYMSVCSNLKYLYLGGCTNIEYSEIRKIKDILTNCINQSYDSKYAIALIDNNVKSLDFKNATLTKSQFESIADCKKLTFLNLKGTKIYYDDSSTLLSTNDINLLFNSILSEFKELTELSLNGFNNLTDATFLKKLTKLVRLDVRNTGITTGTKNEKGDDTGLEIVNSINTLGSLGVNNSTTDLSLIQPAIERCKTENKAPDGIFGIYSGGLICDSSPVLKTLSKCNTIKSLILNLQSEVYTDKNLEIDLSECEKLADFQFRYLYVKKIQMPDNLTSIRCWSLEDPNLYFSENSKLTNIDLNASWRSDFPTTIGNLSNCKKITKLILTRCNVPNSISSLAGCSSLNTLVIQGTENGKNIAKNIDAISALSSLTSLKAFCLYWVNNTDLNFLSTFSSLSTLDVGNTEIADISGVSNLTSLQNVSIYQSKISNIEALSGLTSCKSLDLHNNKISNLSSLKALVELTTLNLENNAIYDMADGESNVNVLLGLHPENGGKLTTLKLLGNNIQNVKALQNLSWTSKSGF